MASTRHVWTLAALAVAWGCSGRTRLDTAGGGGSFDSPIGIGTGGAGGVASGAGGGGVGGSDPPIGCWGGAWCPPACNAAETAFARARLWQITDEQYANVVRDVLGVSLEGADAEIMGPPNSNGEYDNLADDFAPTFTYPLAARYRTAAETVATRASLPDAMRALLGSTTPVEEDVRNFVLSKVARLWRRPVTTDEVGSIVALYDMGLSDGEARGFGLVIEGVLQAPSFLFRTELGGGAAGPTRPFELTPYELAAALSFLFTDSAPDDTLWQHAVDGTLFDPSTVAAEVDRIMSLPAAQERLARYASYWLGIERVPSITKDAALFPEFTPELRSSLYQSGRAFVMDVVTNGSIADLLTSSKVYVNDAMGSVYGVAGATGPTLTPVISTLPERTAGILGQPALLASTSRNGGWNDVVHRGLFVLRSLLCGADVGVIPAPPSEALSIAATMMGDERERAAKRAMTSPCSGCHTNFDPFGLTTLRYDSIGRYDETRHLASDDAMTQLFWTASPKPIDVSATIPPLVGPDLKGSVDGVTMLAQKLATDDPRKRVAYCAAATLGSYAMGRDISSNNSCMFRDLKQHLFESGSFTRFWRELATSPGFATRDP